MPSKLKTKLKENEFYCVSCRGRVNVNNDDICVKIYNNSRTGLMSPALRGKCTECNTNLTKFITHSSVNTMIQKYGKCN